MASPLRTIFSNTRPALLLAAALMLYALPGCSRAATKPAKSISDADRAVLLQYEAVRAALAADNVGKAHLAGERLLQAINAPGVSGEIVKARLAARMMAESFQLELLRAAFKDFSKTLVPMCRGVDGYYIASTDLVSDGLWIQTSKVIDNPYLGHSMALYGEILK